MKVRVCPRGYTIVEVMIFLAVSGGLFVSAAMAMSGQQQKTEFAQGIREIESQIQDVLNDVSTGYYTNTNDFVCTASTPAGRPEIIPTASADKQGANEGCIFLGRVIQFTDGEEFNIFTVAGRRQVVIGLDRKEVKDLDEAKPTVIPSAIDVKTLSYGLKAAKMEYVKSGVSQPIGAVGFFSSLGQYSGANLVSGAQRVDLLPITGSARNLDAAQTAEKINAVDNSSPINPDGGVIVCFNSAGTNQHGIITIGSSGRQLSTKLQINPGSC